MTLKSACGVMWVKVLGEKTSEEHNYEKLNKKGPIYSSAPGVQPKDVFHQPTSACAHTVNPKVLMSFST